MLREVSENSSFGERIKAGGGFVQYQNSWPLQERPGNRGTLSLPT
jgi:hypothetical protein